MKYSEKETFEQQNMFGTGTPNTGTSVFAAIMPGRCAAPPAPAIIT